MMMFALSKINLLILVVALFTIIVYFAFGFQNVLLTNLAGQEVGKVIEQASYLINSKNLCGTIEVSVPEKLTTAAGQGYYFVMEIREVELGDRNSLIFSIINRDEFLTAKRRGREPTIVASDRRNLRASVHIFSIDERLDELCPSSSSILGLSIGGVIIDNTVIVKEVFEGKDHVYVIPCSSASDTSCEENTQKVACWIREKRGEESNCLDIPEPSDCMNIVDEIKNNCPAVS